MFSAHPRLLLGYSDCIGPFWAQTGRIHTLPLGEVACGAWSLYVVLLARRPSKLWVCWLFLCGRRVYFYVFLIPRRSNAEGETAGRDAFSYETRSLLSVSLPRRFHMCSNRSSVGAGTCCSLRRTTGWSTRQRPRRRKILESALLLFQSHVNSG